MGDENVDRYGALTIGLDAGLPDPEGLPLKSRFFATDTLVEYIVVEVEGEKTWLGTIGPIETMWASAVGASHDYQAKRAALADNSSLLETLSAAMVMMLAEELFGD